MRKTQPGFTLIELMIVVAVVAILASIGIPSYRAYIKRAERAEARAAVLDMAQKQERYFSSNNVYLAVPTPPTAAPANWNNFTGQSVAARKYDVTVALSGGGTGYTISAAPSNGNTDPDCGTFALTHTNSRTNTGNTTPSAECWRK
jgi:type IV pilus assembly protein PilE